MAILRLQDRALFIWSPTELTDPLRSAIDSLGEVRWLIAPNSLHHLSLADWAQAYPQAAVYAPPDLRKKRPDLNFSDFPDADAAPWSPEIDHVVVEGNRITTETVFFHVPSRTILFTDLLQQFDHGWFTGWRSLIARLDGMVTPEPAVPRKFRYAFRDKPRARIALQKIVAWPAERLVMAHGTPLHTGAQAAIRRAFAWLLR